jgi:SPP1 family holin
MKNVSLGTLIRTALLILALVNQVLTVTGHSVLPITDTQLTELISVGFTVVTSAVAWWKNNSFTQAAIEADEYKKTISGGAE